MPASSRIQLLIDSREAPSGLVDWLSKAPDVELKVAPLPVGDIVMDSLAIERKTLQDFDASRIDGRLFTQARAMKSAYRRSIFLLEGRSLESWESLNVRGMTAALLSLATRWQIPVIRSLDVRHTSELVLQIARYEAMRSRKKAGGADGPPSGRPKKPPFDRQRFVLEGFPNVGAKKADALLKRFETVRRVVNASESELVAVPGVNVRVARSIQQILDAPYRAAEETEEEEIPRQTPLFPVPPPG